MAVSGTHPARPNPRFVVLTTVWKNLLPPKTIEVPKRGPAGTVSGEKETVLTETPYVVPDLAKHLHLLVDRRYVAHVDPAGARLPEGLPMPRLVVERYRQEVRRAEAGAAKPPVGSRFLLVDVGATSLAPGQIAHAPHRSGATRAPG